MVAVQGAHAFDAVTSLMPTSFPPALDAVFQHQSQDW